MPLVFLLACVCFEEQLDIIVCSFIRFPHPHTQLFSRVFLYFGFSKVLVCCGLVRDLGRLSCPVFCEPPGSVVWYATLIRGHSHSLLLRILLLFSLCTCRTYCKCPPSSEIPFFLSAFQFQKISLSYPQVQRFFLQPRLV